VENPTGFKNYWTDIGENIANGDQIDEGKLHTIYENLHLDKMNPDFLPGESTVVGSASDRKKAIFSLAEKLWGITPEGWLKAENGLLQEARKESGSTKTGGKDRFSDVISAEILIRIVAAAKLYYEDNSTGCEVANEAVRAINVILSEACTKGRARMTMVGDQSVYSLLRQNGLMVGTGGGKYLPYPEKSLPKLLCLLHRDYINPEAYPE